MRRGDGAKLFCGVETIASTHYTKEEGFPNVIHCEGRLFSTFFEVLFWDILYETSVPGTFVMPLQTMPLDLHSGSDFYNNRKLSSPNYVGL